ncbi:hypothetical protein [Nocardioides halotolerans]|uniref:hypothetical protein n=1 Tax=Nocardioides halotolerans TaxID=433660 RepID=UPI00048D8B30|nr:hypothetical protein [Nocardioides halotolerans]
MTDEQDRMREALKLVAVAFKDGGIPFALAGGYALWARGAPEPHHDVDFAVAEADRERTAELLSERGLDVADPPEDWLFKIFVDGAMVDVLFRLNNRPVTREELTGAGELEVESVQMPVLGATALIGAKLAALDERSCDLGRILPAARAVREQVDWEQVAADVAGNDFAEVALILLERLGVVPRLS